MSEILCPFIANLFVKMKYNCIFFFRPITSFDTRVKLVQVSFAALLSSSSFNMNSDFRPKGRQR